MGTRDEELRKVLVSHDAKKATLRRDAMIAALAAGIPSIVGLSLSIGPWVLEGKMESPILTAIFLLGAVLSILYALLRHDWRTREIAALREQAQELQVAIARERYGVALGATAGPVRDSDTAVVSSKIVTVSFVWDDLAGEYRLMVDGEEPRRV